MKNKLGTPIDLDFSNKAIININKLIHLLKTRLASSSKAKSIDKNGNYCYVDLDIYSPEVLAGFLTLSLSDFNQNPPFSYFSFEDTSFTEFFAEVLVSGATLYALSSQALIERGREFSVSGNGIDFNPPTVSEMLETQYSALLSCHWEKVKNIKQSIHLFNKDK